MRTALRSKVVLLFLSFGMLLAFAGVAFAADAQAPDTQAPDTVIDRCPSSGTVVSSSKASENFMFHSTEANSTFEWKGINDYWQSIGTVTNLYEFYDSGTWTFYVRATDAAGNTDATPATCSFNVRVERPTQISAVSGSGTYGGNATLTAKLTSDQGASSVSYQGVDFKLNGRSVGTATTNGSGVAQLSGVSLPGINAGTQTGAVSASFAGGDAGGGNYYASSNGTGDLNVAKASSTTTVTCTGASFTYTGSSIEPCSVSVTGAGGLNGSPTPSYSSNTNAGTATASYTFQGDDNHTGSSDSKNFDIGKAQLSVDAKDQQTVYGDNDLPPSYALSGFANGEDANSAGITGIPDCQINRTNNNVGTYDDAIACTPGTLSAGNYSFVAGSKGKLTITQRPIKVAAVADTRVYDGTTSSNQKPQITGGIVSGDTADFSQAFDTKDVGQNKTLLPSGSVVDGNGGANYKVTFSPNTNGEITAKNLTIDGAVAQGKTYDGNANAAVDFNGATLSRVVGNDQVSVDSSNYSATFDTRNAGQNKPVAVAGVKLGGAGAGNYTVSQPTALKADVSPLGLTGSFTADSKVYDGTRAATVASRSLPGVLGNDAVALEVSNALFDTKDVGASKDVTGSLGLSGAAAGNYSLNASYTAKADITQAPLTITAKDQSGTYNAPLPTNVTYAGLVNGELPSVLGGTLTFGYKDQNGNTATPPLNAGTYTVVPGGLTSGNYNIKFANGTLTVARANQTISFGALSDRSIGDTFQVSATASSNLPVSFSAPAGGPCAVNGTAVTLTGLGTCTITASQGGNGNYDAAQPVSQSFKIAYNFGGFLQPINWTAHQVLDTSVSTFKLGSTVPVKFQLLDANGKPVQVASAQWITPQKGGATSQAVDESVYSELATTGTAYKYDATAQQYIYNWSTKGLSSGYYYKIGVKLDDGQTYYTYISLK